MLIFSCRPSLYLDLENANEHINCPGKIVPEFSSVLFNTSVNITGRHLSGLLFFKTMNDTTTRVVFTNETGNTLFDFEFGKQEFKVVSVIKMLDRKPVIKTLQKDLGLLLRHQMEAEPSLLKKNDSELYFGYKSGKEINWYITDKGCTGLLRIEKATGKKRKVIANVTGYGKGLADSVYINHQAFEFNISLKKIAR